MKIRKYQSNDCQTIAELFYNTVHTVNARDYSKKQLEAWATGEIDLKLWDKSFLEHYTVVAVEDDKIIGFGDIDDAGYLDRLYVHENFQGKGVASTITDKLESYCAAGGIATICTHASITAKPFFEKRGYVVVKEQQVKKSNQSLTNFVMEKYFINQNIGIIGGDSN